MRTLKRVSLFVTLLLTLAGVASAQSADLDLSVGAVYSDLSGASFDNLGASIYVGGLSAWRLSAGSVIDISYNDGVSFLVLARGEISVVGPTYAAVDTPVNQDDRNPRAVFGAQFGDYSLEAYTRIGEQRAYGAAFRYKLPF